MNASILDLLADANVSQSAKVMILADQVVPEQPEPNMNKGYPERIKNNLHDIAWTQWKARMEARAMLKSIAVALNDCCLIPQDEATES